ncbi:sensor histidine kinase [Sphingobacterium spiritivorum]|uniref:histidine kinase n=1 Tax=Sphingobacterium spiritivorum ATCC 33861 TaxID=525373 RepID=D7VLQ0_SPHSI|nr:ATP-binding protein [Sphingobacterium spiritivorum]EFK58523.1 ATPase/histidine kinase/DNA gyrase B/HSP90 domain protein [Sphingobacterium spiritivorum ATCC 33861]QQT37257.1 two-component sensor histidine kinase [Sphingobacterium spiritivorum]WQD34039.1 ATP-binding protein [Sphingobacterium spiritivorum]SUJ29303.1 Alkaline phosphatase synthesis sensor protein phoR [Sphingobacterium spiritivorum]
MNFKLLVLINAAAVGLSISIVSFYYQHDIKAAFIIFGISLIVSFVVFYFLFEKYIYRRINTIYKLIHNLKLGKDLKDALGEYVSDDPITDAEREVRDWAKEKKSEIDKLRSQEKFRREFLSNISHEFKTPLFAIQGYIETLQDGLIEEDPEMAKGFLDKASKNLDRLSYLIHDLDEISKLESGRISLNIEKFDLSELIKETIENLDDKARSQKIDIVFKQKYQNVTFVKADRKKIQQVLTNLIDNSIKYGKTGGSTDIRIFPLFEQVLVEVTDDGQGIEEKNLPRVFERFYRTDKSRSRGIGGSGLGLAIVKHIVEAHQQNVNVRSTEGIGTTFGFTLEKSKN